MSFIFILMSCIGYIFSTYCCIPSSPTSQQQLPGIKRELMPFASFSFYSLLTMAINRFLKTRNEISIDVSSPFSLLQQAVKLIIQTKNGLVGISIASPSRVNVICSKFGYTKSHFTHEKYVVDRGAKELVNR